jgi:hypothetical protein
MPHSLVQQFNVSEKCITYTYRAKELAKQQQQQEAITYSSALKLEVYVPLKHR